MAFGKTSKFLNGDARTGTDTHVWKGMTPTPENVEAFLDFFASLDEASRKAWIPASADALLAALRPAEVKKSETTAPRQEAAVTPKRPREEEQQERRRRDAEEMERNRTLKVPAGILPGDRCKVRQVLFKTRRQGEAVPQGFPCYSCGKSDHAPKNCPAAIRLFESNKFPQLMASADHPGPEIYAITLLP